MGLRWRDIDFNKRVLRIQQTLSHDGKKLMPGAKSTAGIRSVALSKSTIAALLEHREMIYNERAALGDAYVDNDLVICTEKGTPALPRDIMKRWKKLLAKLNIRYITYHSCRHTAASLLLLANIHPKVVSEMLGHASVRLTLDIYSHLLPNMQDEAVNKVDTMMEEEIELEATVSEEALEASDMMDDILEDN